ncbi:MAG: energy transducer TonB [Marinilabiliaceae bacterium]|nr:energy transducer TonB [Marinilabiliaceae bacterium]
MEENKNQKEKVNGYIGSVIFHAALILLLLFVGFTSIPQEEEGIIVDFGDSIDGFGTTEPVRNEPTGTKDVLQSPETSMVSSQTPSQTSVKENLMTQEYEETVKMNASEKEKQNKKAEQERKQREEQERRKREEDRKKAEEQERKLAEERRKKEEQERMAEIARNNVNQAFSKTQGSGSSEGNTQGTGNQGHLTGDPNAPSKEGTGPGTTGSSFSLAGRSLVGKLPKPVDNCNEEGVIVVEITVDKTGVVTSANAIPRGSKNFTPCLIKAAQDAALKARFNNDAKASLIQKGTITYHFGFS